MGRPRQPLILRENVYYASVNNKIYFDHRLSAKPLIDLSSQNFLINFL